MRNSGLFLSFLILAAVWLAGCAQEAPEAAPASRYQLGDKATVGHLSYVVFETQWVTHFGEGITSRIPQNRFFLVRMSVVNGGANDATIPNMTIEDDAGHTYNELSDGEGVPQWMGYLRSVKPADSLLGNVVFDAPPAHYRIRLTDDQRHAALVDIPLSFGAETPDMPGLTPEGGLKK